MQYISLTEEDNDVFTLSLIISFIAGTIIGAALVAVLREDESK